jgi:uncharacterized protein DUF2752
MPPETAPLVADTAVDAPLVPPGEATRAAAPSGMSEQGGAFLRLGIVAALAAGAVAIARFVTLPAIPLCAFKLWTGRPCPGCGMTRSIVHLAEGDVAGSFRLHPLGIVFAACGLLLAAGATVGAVRGEDPVWRWLQRRGGVAVFVLVGALLAVWVLRTFVVPEWAPDPIGPAFFAGGGAR